MEKSDEILFFWTHTSNGYLHKAFLLKTAPLAFVMDREEIHVPHYILRNCMQLMIGGERRVIFLNVVVTGQLSLLKYILSTHAHASLCNICRGSYLKYSWK